MDHDFAPLVQKKGTILEPSSNFESPYLPDLILNAVYDPFTQKADDTFRSLEVNLEQYHFFNDPAFEKLGKELLLRLLKVLILDSRITENWLITGATNLS
jgi:hypothetical protein